MHPIYCADPAIQTAIADALDLHGLRPDPAAVTHRPRCADCLTHQLLRLARSTAVLETVRTCVHVEEPTRHLIERLVDSASDYIEREEATIRHAEAPRQHATAYVSPAERIIYSTRSTKKAVRA